MKAALITGVSGGIGRVLVERLVGNGYRVIGVARREEKLRELKSLFGEKFDYITADLSEGDVSRHIKQSLESLGISRLDLLINNAGFAVRKPLTDHEPEELENIFRVNAMAPIELTRELLPLLEWGSTVVFVVSGVAFVNVPEIPSYCAAKGALHHLVLNLERELSERGIHILRVYPKQVRTEFWGGRIPKGSIEPEKVADAILGGIEKRKREVFVPSYMKLVKYLPNWPVFTYRFKY
ncbi:SDR family NAD(P)-dependent oxidoreductase [Thermococcus sp. M36]|uniref:SDR family NAD(P)-dependent oxidoreductase n=1 Tax=Thermococcus sp. M36 TaxID=1638261 RepID=UPI001438B236|nr:SDR family NAD(P)-dependent oxidoreductase [Thermococcus sp. M36]NJE05966.1 SDR family NAD(P)-dependent oxidoreductase [Thermococcus sp. M36]